MVALNHRNVVVNATSVDELLCQKLKGRLVYERKAGHVQHECSGSPGLYPFQLLAVLLEEERRQSFWSWDKPASRGVDINGAYRVLQLDAGASAEMAKSAFRRLSREYHPDVNPQGLERMKCISQAYGVLKRSGRA